MTKCEARELIRATNQNRTGGYLPLSDETSRSDICASPGGALRIWAMKQWLRENIQESQLELEEQREKRQGGKWEEAWGPDGQARKHGFDPVGG